MDHILYNLPRKQVYLQFNKFWSYAMSCINLKVQGKKCSQEESYHTIALLYCCNSPISQGMDLLGFPCPWATRGAMSVKEVILLVWHIKFMRRHRKRGKKWGKHRVANAIVDVACLKALGLFFSSLKMHCVHKYQLGPKLLRVHFY